MDRLWSVGLALGLLASVGCRQSSTADYHELTEHTADNVRLTSAESPPAAEPISVPMAADPVVEAPVEAVPVVVDEATVPEVQPASAVVIATPAEIPVESPPVNPPADGVPGANPSGDSPSADSPPAIKPGKIELLIPEKTFQPEGKEQALRVSFDDIDLLKVLNMEPVPLDAVNYFPGWLSGLDGQKIRLRGWMFPPLEQEGLTGFLFVRDNQICCFGRNPKVYDKVIVELREGETTRYIQGRPFDVIGTFSIQAEESDGELLILYFIEDAVVIDK